METLNIITGQGYTYNQQLKSFQDKLLKIYFPDLSTIQETTSIILNTESLLNMIDNMILILSQNNIMCEITSENISDYFIKIDLTDFNISIPHMLIKNISNCLNSRYIIIPISIMTYAGGHLNIVIIDTFNKIVEYFEPHGEYSGIYYPFNLTQLIQHIIKILFKLSHYTFKDVHSLCPINARASGIQGIQESYRNTSEGGFCAAWSMLYVHLRLFNPTITSDDIIVFLTTLPPSQLDSYIKRYVALNESHPILSTKLHLNKYNLSSFLSDKETLDTNTYIYNLLNKFFESGDKDIYKELLTYMHLPKFDQLLFFFFNNKKILDFPSESTQINYKKQKRF